MFSLFRDGPYPLFSSFRGTTYSNLRRKSHICIPLSTRLSLSSTQTGRNVHRLVERTLILKLLAYCALLAFEGLFGSNG